MLADIAVTDQPAFNKLADIARQSQGNTTIS
jgi:ribosomal protein L20